MNSYITLRKIKVQSANCIAGITYGFPAITSFLGFVRALSTKLQKSHGITLNGCAVVAHKHQLLTYKLNYYSEYYFSQTKNPFAGQYQQKDLNKTGKTPPVIEEGKMHLTISLVIECQGFSGTDEDKLKLEKHVENLILTHRLAGGVITDIEKVIYENIHNHNNFLQCRRRLMPGFILMDRSQYLTEHYTKLKQDDPNTDMLNAWLDFCSIKYQAKAQVPENEILSGKSKAHWQLIEKPKAGYLVPLMTGYQAISEVYSQSEVKNTRDSKTPFCFTEAVYGIGEWLSPHRLTNLNDAIWRNQYEEERYYVCKQDIVKNNNQTENFNDNDIDELIIST